MNFENSRYVLIDYINNILLTTLKSLANMHSNSLDLFTEINELIENRMNKEKIGKFVDEILLEFQNEIEKEYIKEYAEKDNDTGINRDREVISIKKNNLKTKLYLNENNEISREIVIDIFTKH